MLSTPLEASKGGSPSRRAGVDDAGEATLLEAVVVSGVVAGTVGFAPVVGDGEMPESLGWGLDSGRAVVTLLSAVLSTGEVEGSDAACGPAAVAVGDSVSAAVAVAVAVGGSSSAITGLPLMVVNAIAKTAISDNARMLRLIGEIPFPRSPFHPQSENRLFSL
jgi:hypothetical protein